MSEEAVQSEAPAAPAPSVEPAAPESFNIFSEESSPVAENAPQQVEPAPLQ